jgi:hypothetical protein
MYKKVFCLLSVLVLCGMLLAQTPYQIYNWAPETTGVWAGAASGDWNDPTMWRDGVVPGGTAKTISREADFSAAQLNLIETCSYGEGEPWMIYAHGEAARQINSPALWTAQTISINSPVSVGAITFGDRVGTKTVLNVNSDLTLGGGTGRFTLSGYSYDTTTVNQNSGTVSCGEIRLPGVYSGVYNLYGGTLRAAGVVYLPRRNSGYQPAFSFSEADKLGNVIYDSTNAPVNNYDAGGYIGTTYANSDPTDHTTLDGLEPITFAKMEMNIFGGVADLYNLNFGSYPASAAVHGVVTVYDGALLYLATDRTASVASWIADGYLVGGNGMGLIYSYDDVTNKTLVHVIPEPATMLLLGLGAFGLIRRKRN